MGDDDAKTSCQLEAIHAILMAFFTRNRNLSFPSTSVTEDMLGTLKALALLVGIQLTRVKDKPHG